MTHTEQLAQELQSPHRLIGALKRLRPILVAILAIGLATGAAFVALVWLDGSMRILTPSVIRLGGIAPGPAAVPLSAAPAAG